MKKFPENFLWGAAMSAPQTEGQSLNFGKSATTWDYWFQTAPEKFHQQQGPAITSDVYGQYLKDCQRMQEIGLNSVRTSISWARLLPDGKTVNPQAVAFYRQYFTAMRDHGVVVAGKVGKPLPPLPFTPRHHLSCSVIWLKNGRPLTSRLSMWNAATCISITTQQ